jgi:hypothetical protein
VDGAALLVIDETAGPVLPLNDGPIRLTNNVEEWLVLPCL